MDSWQRRPVQRGKMEQTGYLIGFEGGEGVGKTTQIRLTASWLQTQVRQPVLVTREPGGTPLGQELRQLLLHGEMMAERTELLLFAADRAEHVCTMLQPAIASGSVVLCDRYTDSTVAYQHYGRGLERALIDQLNHIATRGLTCDLTFWLDLDVQTGLQRSRSQAAGDRIEQTDLQFHQRVRTGFTALAAQYPDRIVRIDANRPVSTIQAEIQTQLSARLDIS